MVALYGTWTAGGIAVPISDVLRSAQVAHIVSNSGSRFFVSSPRRMRGLETNTLDGAELIEVGAEPGDGPGPARGLAGGSEPAAILYTSGSTGRAKGILISHANLQAGARIVARYLRMQPDERILSVMPFNFDYGLNQLLTAVEVGASLHLQRSLHPADVCRVLRERAITAMAGVPPFWIQLLDRHSPFSTMSFPDLRFITNTGGAFPLDLLQRYRALLPDTRIVLMYGLSEAFRSTYLPPEELDRRPNSIGKAIPETQIHVLNERGEECGPGETGELVHCGPTVALGYWQDPSATATVFRPHPFEPESGATVVYSGDMVRRDEAGFLTFVGRQDGLIKSHGYRISPEEVEELIYGSGLADQVVVKGEPHPVAGASVVAHVVPRSPETFTTATLLDYCRREMPRYMVPAKVHVHESLPRGATGKVDRTQVVP